MTVKHMFQVIRVLMGLEIIPFHHSLLYTGEKIIHMNTNNVNSKIVIIKQNSLHPYIHLSFMCNQAKNM